MARISEHAKELRRIWGGFQSSRVLITSNNLRVFDLLDEGKTARQIAGKLKTDGRATEILLDALTGMGLLKKNRDHYRNREIASKLLVSGRPFYQGDIIGHAGALWDKWSSLDTVLKTGRPAARSRSLRAFILGMHNLAALKAREIIDEINLSGVSRVLDLGGGPGTYSLELARRGIASTLFDLPDTVKIAREVISRSPASAKLIEVIGGDFNSDDIGNGYDLIFVSQILHMFSGTVNTRLLRKCRKALAGKGRVIIQEFLMNEKRTEPQSSALFSINMLVNTEGGRTYTPDEMKGWLIKSGFRKVGKKILEDVVLISAETQDSRRRGLR